MNSYNGQNEQGSALKRYAVNLVDLARQGKLDPVIGNQKGSADPEQTYKEQSYSGG